VIRLSDPQLEAILLEAPVATPRTSATSLATNVLFLGFDTEWDAQLFDRPLLSAQFAGYVDETLHSRCYDPPGRRLTTDSLLDFVLRFANDEKIVLPISESKKRKSAHCQINLLVHFGGAEIGMIQDHFRDLIIQPIGQKGHHAIIPSMVRDGVTFSVRLLDTFAFFPVALADLGKAVGLPKIDVGSRCDLARLKKENPELFDAYGRRDAEITLVMYRKFRAYIWERYQIDVLRRRSLAGTGCEIFLRHYLKASPAPARVQNLIRPVRGGDNEWRDQVRQVMVYNGPPERRIMAASAYAGGRAEAHIFGLLKGDLVERDVRSLYPSSAILQPLPHAGTRFRVLKGNLSEHDLVGVEGFGVVRFAFPRDTKFPCLPVIQPKRGRMLYPLQGMSFCTVAEMRAAISFGAELVESRVFVFAPGESERNHDIARYMRALMAEKANYKKGQPEYEITKLLLNTLIGKLAEREQPNYLLTFERAAAKYGFAGAGKILASAVNLRDSLHGLPKVGSLFMPEQATLILGKARALMAEFVAKGAYLVSTDSVIIDRSISMECKALDELRSVESDLTVELEVDAFLSIRTRMYFLFQRPDNIRLPLSLSEPFAVDDQWAVVKVARHGLPVEKKILAEAVLASLRAKRLLDEPLPRKQLLSAVSAVRMGLELNAEVCSERMPIMEWDNKRILKKPRVNPWRTCSDSRPVTTAGRLTAAQEQGVIVNASRRRKRRVEARAKRQKVFMMLASNASVREISKATGVPRSTVQDMKRKLATHIEGFLGTQGIKMPEDVEK
jgi:hypothetical protein